MSGEVAAGPWIRPPRQLRSQETLERLLDAGEGLLAQYGYAGMRLRDVADAAGSTVGAFYLRFGEKESLFRAIQDRFIERTRARWAADLAPERFSGRSAEEVVTRLVGIVVTTFRENRALLRAFAHKRALESEPGGPMRGFGLQVAAWLVAVLAERRHELAAQDLECAVGFGMQMVLSTLVAAVLNDPGPIVLDDKALLGGRVHHIAQPG